MISNLSPVVLHVMLELFLKSAVVLSLAFAAHFAFRKASAANRNLIWVAAFVGLLCLPLTKLVTPLWTLRAEQTAVASLPAATESKGMTVRASVSNSNLGDAPQPSATQTPTTQFSVSRLNLVGFFLFAWLGGVSALLAHRGFITMTLSRLIKESRPVQDTRLLTLLHSVADRAGISPREIPPIGLSTRYTVPMIVGVFRPVILLPHAALEWDSARLEATLQHELAHFIRRDCLVRTLADIACIAYWPNPLVWMAARANRLEQEQACDDHVLRLGVPAADYASQLVDVARGLRNIFATAPTSLAMAHPSTLETRVRAIVDYSVNRRPLTLKTTLASAMFLSAMLTGSALAQTAGPSASPSASASESPRVINVAPGTTLIVNKSDPAIQGATINVTKGAVLILNSPDPSVSSDAIPTEVRQRAAEMESKFRAAHEEASRLLSQENQTPQVSINTKFLQISSDSPMLKTLEDIQTGGKNTKTPPSGNITGMTALSKEQALTIQNAIKQNSGGVEVLQAPQVLSKSGFPATVEGSRELQYVHGSDYVRGEDGKWKAKNFETRKTGISLDVLPVVKPNNEIVLTVSTNFTAFNGYQDLDSKEILETETDSANNTVLPKGFRDKGQKVLPIFQNHILNTTVEVSPGNTLVIGGLSPDKGTTQAAPQHLYILLSAEILPPGQGTESANPALSTTAVPRSEPSIPQKPK